MSGLDPPTLPPLAAREQRRPDRLRFVGNGRYNKTLLGDKLGKFPAPLLMNTVHFALQAGLSKLIILFQSKGPEAAVTMGWKDYFMRGVDLAL